MPTKSHIKSNATNLGSYIPNKDNKIRPLEIQQLKYSTQHIAMKSTVNLQHHDKPLGVCFHPLLEGINSHLQHNTLLLDKRL